MSWVTLSLLAPAMLTAVIFVDKFVLTHRLKDTRGIQLYQSVTAVGFALALMCLQAWRGASEWDALVLVAAGMITTFGSVLYFYGLARSESSDVAALLQITPIFTLVLATVFLGERLTGGQMIGFALVMVAVLGLTAQSAGGKLRPGAGFYAVVAADVFFAVSAVMIKFASGLTGFAAILLFECVGTIAAGLLLFVFWRPMRRAFLASLRDSGAGTLAIMFGNEGLYILSKAVTYLAILLGPVALVSVLGGTQVFYGLLFGVLLSLWFPKLYHESTSRPVVLRRAALMLVLFAGIVVVQA